MKLGTEVGARAIRRRRSSGAAPSSRSCAPIWDMRETSRPTRFSPLKRREKRSFGRARRAASPVCLLPCSPSDCSTTEPRSTCRSATAVGLRPGDVIATVRCQGRALLSAERTALNYLGHLSGVASVTRRLVDAVRAAGASTDVVCTRKTTPGFRALEKYAVRCGGGANHRFGLDDAILIKDNHIALAGGVREAVRRVRERSGHMVKVEVEVDTLEQLDVVLELGVEVVLLDNMRGETLAEAVRRCKGRLITEASGGIDLETGPIVAQSGVDLMSVGWLTHSAPCLDIGLDIDLSSAV